MAELARHGWAPAMSRDGLERTDILAVLADPENRRMVETQVILRGAHPGRRGYVNSIWPRDDGLIGDHPDDGAPCRVRHCRMCRGAGQR